jgi:hypothetical protein
VGIRRPRSSLAFGDTLLRRFDQSTSEAGIHIKEELLYDGREPGKIKPKALATEVISSLPMLHSTIHNGLEL